MLRVIGRGLRWFCRLVLRHKQRMRFIENFPGGNFSYICDHDPDNYPPALWLHDGGDY